MTLYASPEVEALSKASSNLIGAGHRVAMVLTMVRDGDFHTEDMVASAVEAWTEASRAWRAASDEVFAMNKATEASIAAVRKEQGIDQ